MSQTYRMSFLASSLFSAVVLVGCTAGEVPVSGGPSPVATGGSVSTAPTSADSPTPSALADRAPTGVALDRELRAGFGTYGAHSFGDLLAVADNQTEPTQEFSAGLKSGESLIVVFACKGDGAVDVEVKRGDESVVHIWNDKCAPDVAYGGLSAALEGDAERLVLVVTADQGVDFSVVVEGPPKPIS